MFIFLQRIQCAITTWRRQRSVFTVFTFRTIFSVFLLLFICIHFIFYDISRKRFPRIVSCAMRYTPPPICNDVVIVSTAGRRRCPIGWCFFFRLFHSQQLISLFFWHMPSRSTSHRPCTNNTFRTFNFISVTHSNEYCIIIILFTSGPTIIIYWNTIR